MTEQAESIAAIPQAKSLLPIVKPPVPKAFKSKIDGKTILSFIFDCELCFTLVSISNRYLQALFTVRLQQRPIYTLQLDFREHTWFIT